MSKLANMDDGIKRPRDNARIWDRLFIGGEALPGIVQSVRLGGALQMDRETVSGQSGVVITDVNWTEDSATFELLVLAAELKRFNEFRSKYKGSAGVKPMPVNVGHPLLQSFGITKMLVSGVEINWNNTQKDRVPVTVSLTNISPKLKDAQGSANERLNAPTSGIALAKAVTNPPVSIKPSSIGTAFSNAIAGQPAFKFPDPPTIPSAARKTRG
jgi:hypothetical protein